MEPQPNPYESPIIPSETAAGIGPIAFVATFTMDDAGLQASARMNTASLPRWLVWLSPLWLISIMLFLLVIVTEWGAVAFFCCGFLLLVAAITVQAARNRRLSRRTLELLRAHPMFGAVGVWRLTVDENESFLETPGGRQAFSPSEMSFLAEENRQLLIRFGNEMTIVIPDGKGDAGKQLRHWIQKWRGRTETGDFRS